MSVSATALLLPIVLAAAPTPDWVLSGGRSAQHPAERFLTGFAVASRPEAARDQAAADLAKKIVLRIEQQTTDLVAETAKSAKYELAMVTRATTDVRVAGLDYAVHSSGNEVYALAFAPRDTVIAQLVARRASSLATAQSCLRSAAGLAKQQAAGPALNAYLGCRAPVLSAIEDDAIVAAIDPRKAHSADALAQLHRDVEDGVQALLRKKVAGLGDAVEVLVAQLASLRGPFTVAPLTYGTTAFSSELGRRLAEDLESALAGRTGGEPVVLRGTYAKLDDQVAITVTARSLKRSEPVGGARVVVPLVALPASLPLEPQNFTQALASARLLAQGEAVSGALRLELWTNKGDRNLVYRKGDEVKLFMRVNRPAYVRLVYLMASGAKVPLEQAYYVDSSKVNRAVEYPDAFEVSAPLGVEQLFGVAYTDKPQPVATEPLLVEGERYEVVTDKNLVRHRGLKRKLSSEISEATLTLTTTP